MALGLLCVLVLASSSRSARGASAPNCTGVGDFEVCLGNTADFCPDNISCLCKNEQPFCRCDYFRVGWKDYWYMGPKCNHLWNTLDFILVATVPAVGLVLIVVVIFSCVYCCKSEQPGKQPTLPQPEAQQNPAFTADTAAHMGYPQPPRNWDAWGGQFPKAVVRRQDFDDISLPSQGGNYRMRFDSKTNLKEHLNVVDQMSRVPYPVYSQPLRTPGAATDRSSLPRSQWEGSDFPSRKSPYADYAEGRPYRNY